MGRVLRPRRGNDDQYLHDDLDFDLDYADEYEYIADHVHLKFHEHNYLDYAKYIDISLDEHHHLDLAIYVAFDLDDEYERQHQHD